MDFFGDYSIETASCHPSSLSETQYNGLPSPSYTSGPLSPIDVRTSYPVDLANMSNLARAFGLQNLDAAINEPEPFPDFAPDYVFSSEAPPSPTRLMSANSRSPCWRRRFQRQRDVHMQADPAHLRSISELVERMVDEGDQCAMTRRRGGLADISITPATAALEDEDTFDDSDPSTPRSLSSSSSTGHRRNSSLSDFESPAQRRPAVPSRTGRITKSKPKRVGGRERK